MIKYVKIEGIHCEHCIETITNEFLKNKFENWKGPKA